MPSRKLKPKPKRNTYTFEAIGTVWEINTYDQSLHETIRQAITDRIETFDATYSRFRTDSLVTRMASQVGTYTLPDDAQPLLGLYESLYKTTDGAVTPLIGQLMSDAGYDAHYSFIPKPLRDVPSWDDAIRYEAPQLTVKQPIILDIGAAGKGYLVDIIGALLESWGITTYYINAGGDIRHRHPAVDMRIGLENPLDTTEIVGISQIQNMSFCGSAANHRKWGAYHHTINPKTQTSPTHVQAVWVSAASTMLADGLTTALYFQSPELLQHTFSFEYAIIDDQSHVTHSPHFPGTFFTKGIAA